jgi:hypothetical protein
MKKSLALFLALGLTFGLLGGPAAGKKKKKPKFVDHVLYFHGTEQFGEMESFSGVSDAYLPMDPKEPDGSNPRSKQLTNYVAGPNSECAGNTLYPVWLGDLSGRVKGDVTVTFSAISTPGQVDVRIWPDVTSLLCNFMGDMNYPEPAGETTVDLPPGPAEIEAVIEGVNFQAESKLMVQITPVNTPPFFGRVLYDSTSEMSRVEFKCAPKKGKTC